MIYKSKKAFTLIELSISLVFISFLLLAITYTTIQIGNTYNYGISTKAVGQAGRAIISDMQQEIRSIKPFDPTLNRSDFIEFIGSPGVTGGRLCIGTYSYIWNTASAIKNNSFGANVYTDSSSTIRFVKVQDTNKAYCADQTIKIDKSKSKELLATGDKNLAIYDLNITSPDTSNDVISGSRLYYFEIYLGTENSDLVNLDNTGKYKCSDTNVTYCVVELFSISVLSGV